MKRATKIFLFSIFLPLLIAVGCALVQGYFVHVNHRGPDNSIEYWVLGAAVLSGLPFLLRLTADFAEGRWKWTIAYVVCATSVVFLGFVATVVALIPWTGT